MLLQIRQEADVLTTAPDLASLMAPWAPGEIGRRLVVEPPSHISAEDLSVTLKGKAGGSPVPTWAHGIEGRLSRGLTIYRVKDALHTTQWGAVITADGSVLHQSVEEALYGTPTLAGLPHVEMVGGDAVMTPPGDVLRLKRGTVFCAAGGLINYGHFVLDCLSTLIAIEQRGLTRAYPPLIPAGLKGWHHQLLARSNAAYGNISVPPGLIRVDDLLYASPMAHFLAYPGSLLRDVRNRMIGDVVSGKRKIYLSRLGDKKREMTNEAELEQRLVDRGFEIVRPEKLSIQKQIDLLKGSSVVAGAVGAAMTNCLFLPSGANIFEIQPSNYQDSFVRSMCDVLSMNWYPFFCQSPRDETSVMVEGKERHGYFSFDLPLEAFLAFIDGAMPQERTVGKKSRTPSLGWLGFSR